MKLGVRDAARLLAEDEDTVYRWARDGTLPCTRINDQYRINSTDLFEWATARGHRLSAHALEDGGDAPSLAAALEAGGVHTWAGPATRDEVLSAVVAAQTLDEGERLLLLDLVLAREFIGSTGIGEGIAIPHARMPVVVHGAVGSMALWYLAEPVELGGERVDTIFFLVSSAPRVHLKLLQRVALALHDPDFRRAVKARAPLDVVVGHARRLEGASRGEP